MLMLASALLMAASSPGETWTAPAAAATRPRAPSSIPSVTDVDARSGFTYLWAIAPPISGNKVSLPMPGPSPRETRPLAITANSGNEQEKLTIVIY